MTEDYNHSGHQLAREIIKKHGRDRYPTVELSLIKVMEELGELSQAVLKPDGTQPPRSDRIRKEYADVGISLYSLGNKLGLDLIDEMRQVVENETRKFA